MLQEAAGSPYWDSEDINSAYFLTPFEEHMDGTTMRQRDQHRPIAEVVNSQSVSRTLNQYPSGEGT